nr:hypothetical protein [Tanacetum cinerariifolium]
MAFISSSKNSSNEDGNTTCVTTASTAFSTGSVNVATISQDTASAYIASQSNGLERRLAYKDQMWQGLTNQKLSASTVIRWAILQESAEHPEVRKEEGKKAIDKGEDHALVTDGEAPTEFALMANTESKVFDNSLCSNEYKELEELKLEKDGLDGKLVGLLKASKNLDHLIESQRSDQVKEGVGYNVVPPPAADLYLSPKKDLSWTGLSEFVDDTVTNYSRPSPTSPSHRSGGHRPHGAPMRPPLRSSGHRPHGGFMRPSHRPAGHRPHGPLMNPRRSNMNCARPNISFFIQAPSYETRSFLKSSAVKTQYRAPWVPTVNRNNPPVNRKFSTGSRKFPTANRKFPTASRKFTTGSTKNHTDDMGRKGKDVKPLACWTWNPSQKLSNKGPITNSVLVMFKKYTYIDTQGRLKSATYPTSLILSHLMEDMCLLVKEDARLQEREPLKLNVLCWE